MSNRKYLITKKVSYFIIALVVILLIIDIFFVDKLGFGNNKFFLLLEGIVFVLFLFSEFLKWHFKRENGR